MADIDLPIPGVTPSPEWAPKLNTSIEAINVESTVAAGAVQLGGTVYADDFTATPDGVPATLLTGQDYRMWPLSGSRTPRVVDGQLTFASDAEAGGYASVDSPDLPINHIEASMTFTPYTESGGLGCLALMESNIGDSYDDEDGVPRSPAHLIVSPEGWSFGVFRTHGGSLELIAHGTYSPPLVADGETTHLASVTLDSDDSVAYLSIPLPNGGQRVLRFSDPIFGDVAAYSAYIEPFKTTSAPTHTLAGFRSWGVATQSRQAVLRSRERYSLDGYPTLYSYTPTTSIDVPEDVVDPIDADNVRAIGKFGPTGSAHIAVTAIWAVEEDADLYLCLRYGSDGEVVPGTAIGLKAPGGATTQTFSTILPVSGEPFAPYDFMISHGVYGAGATIPAGSNSRIVWTCTPG